VHLCGGNLIPGLLLETKTSKNSIVLSLSPLDGGLKVDTKGANFALEGVCLAVDLDKLMVEGFLLPLLSFLSTTSGADLLEEKGQSI